MKVLQAQSPGFPRLFREFCRAAETPPAVVQAVRTILQEVREKGDPALLRYLRELDRARLRTAARIRVSPTEIEEARQALSREEVRALRASMLAVKRFHRKGLPRGWRGPNPDGAEVGEGYHPLRRVGIYIPSGQAPLVSTVVMTVTLAREARVPEIAAFTPCRKDGTVDPAVLAALDLAGVTEVYRLGGAVAVAAMTWGTRTVPPVDKIFGPGNVYLNEAKRQVFGEVGIDILAGPSEVMILTDDSARADWVAADLLAQAEHDPRAKVVFTTGSRSFAREVASEWQSQAAHLQHASNIRRVWEEGALGVLVDSLDRAVEVANAMAPEHLELHLDPEAAGLVVDRVCTAGAVFIGSHTPTVLGDYLAGPSHTLPTARTGRFASGLRVTDFMRRTSYTRYSASSLRRAIPSLETIGRMEGLDAHRASARIRGS